MMQLTWLKIHRFRNVKPGTELHFGPKFNVLLGKNASGKTTLLDLAAAVADDDLAKYESDDELGFEIEYRLRTDSYQFDVTRSSLPNGKPQTKIQYLQGYEISEPTQKLRTLELRIADAQNQVIFRCHAQGNSATCGWKDKEGFALELGASAWSVLHCLFEGMSQAPPQQGPEELRKGVFEHLITPRFFRMMCNEAPRFDEAMRAFGKIGEAVFKTSVAKGASIYEFFPMKLGGAIDGRLQANPDDYSKSFDFADVAELDRVLPLLGFAMAELRPQLEERRSNSGDTEYDFKGVNMVFERPSGDLIRADLLSFGQKRLLSFYWYLAVRGDLPVVADELANGLHHEWIEACVKELSERQSFLATQNPLLLDFLPAGTPDTTLIHCSTDSTDGHGTMCWRNFTDEEQARLDAAYGVGIQQVSEILRSEGLW